MLTVLQKGLAFPNGVTLNKDKSFLPVAESNSMKILKFWIQGERVTFFPQPFAQLSKFPGNIEMETFGLHWTLKDEILKEILWWLSLTAMVIL